MSNINQEIRQFFSDYEQAFADGLAGKPDIKTTCGAFAHSFVEASQLGVQGYTNDNVFKDNIAKGFEFYRSIGTKTMVIDTMDITQIDAYHYQVKAHWKAHYTQVKLELDLEFDVIYMVQHLNNELEIFAYINGDEQLLLRKHGLI